MTKIEHESKTSYIYPFPAGFYNELVQKQSNGTTNRAKKERGTSNESKKDSFRNVSICYGCWNDG
ncbi:MAG: hypothetical protein K5819_06215, partial [Lachnospiraceae bacterium]|nr:hypothetical protein [Lachnospiraceae bacterium]